MEKKKYQLSFQFNQQVEQKAKDVLSYKPLSSSRALKRESIEPEGDVSPQRDLYKKHSAEEPVQELESDNIVELTRSGPRIPIHYRGHKRRQREFVSEMTLSSRSGKRKRWVKGLKKSSKLLMIAAAAIAIGIVFGLVVLNIFSNLANEQNTVESITEQPRQNEQRSAQQQPEQAVGEQQGTVSQENPALIPTGAVQEGQLQLIPRSYYVVQAGAFSELQAAQVMLKQYTDQGYAGLVLDQLQPYRLYVGVASLKEDANLLGQYYVEQGFETYVKEHNTASAKLELPLPEQELEQISAFIAQGDLLVSQISQVMAECLGNTSVGIAAEAFKGIQELHRGYLQTGNAVFANWEGTGKEQGERMMQELSTAVNAIETYQKQNHVSFLWQAQQALLFYVHAYENFVATGKK